MDVYEGLVVICAPLLFAVHMAQLVFRVWTLVGR